MSSDNRIINILTSYRKADRTGRKGKKRVRGQEGKRARGQEERVPWWAVGEAIYGAS